MQSVSLAASAFRLRRLSDPVVATRALDGDPSAFSELHRRYKRRVTAVCSRNLSGSSHTEDAVQETFLRVLRAAPQQIENVDAWLLTIARNVCLDLLRKRSNSEQATNVDDVDFQNSLPVADSATDLLRRENARQVFLALRRLPTKYRTALSLREFHGMTSAEIAEAMSLSPGAVDPMVSRARDAFGAAYAEVSGFPDACRVTVERVYRDMGSGIDDGERAQAIAHVAKCPRCRAEYKRARSPRYMQGLLPFLVAKMPNLGVLADALTRSAEAPSVMQSVPLLAATAVATLSTAAVLSPIAIREFSPPKTEAHKAPVAAAPVTGYGATSIADPVPSEAAPGEPVAVPDTVVVAKTVLGGERIGAPQADAAAAVPAVAQPATPTESSSPAKEPSSPPSEPKPSDPSPVSADPGTGTADPSSDPEPSDSPPAVPNEDGWAELPNDAVVVDPSITTP